MTISKKKRQRRGRPPRITNEQILEVACQIGVRDLTLGAVAKALDVSVAALYHYFTDRDQLAEFVADVIVAQHPLPADSTADWFEWAHIFAHRQLVMFEQVPGLAQLAMQRTIRSAVPRLEQSVRVAIKSGFDETTAWWATRAVQEFVFSWVSRNEMRAALAERTGESYTVALSRVTKEFAPGESPCLRSIVAKYPVEPDHERFEFNLRALLAGLAAIGMKAGLDKTSSRVSKPLRVKAGTRSRR